MEYTKPMVEMKIIATLNIKDEKDIGIIQGKIPTIIEGILQIVTEKIDVDYTVEVVCDKSNQEKNLDNRDKLTGLYNRNYATKCLNYHVDMLRLAKKPISLALINIDFFKNYNDKYGHLLGDKLLIELAKIVECSVRNIDIGARYAGNEFIIIMPCTTPQEANTVIGRLQKNIFEKKFHGEKVQPLKKITVSIGLVTNMKSSRSADRMILHAENNLQKARKSGKNNVKSTIC